ncbi:hypothetical protein V6Z11_D13G141200 [Gossypium hirsutum]
MANLGFKVRFLYFSYKKFGFHITHTEKTKKVAFGFCFYYNRYSRVPVLYLGQHGEFESLLLYAVKQIACEILNSLKHIVLMEAKMKELSDLLSKGLRKQQAMAPKGI